MNVRQLMTTDVKRCSADATLDVVARHMWESDCGAIPIVDNQDHPLGIVTDRDIAMAAMLNHAPLWEIPASSVIQGQQLACCSPEEPVQKCLDKMQECSVRRILVTDDNGALCGIVSLGDTVAFTQSSRSSSSQSNKQHGRQMQQEQQGKIDSGQMIDMLRSVSAHHQDSATFH